VVWVEREKGKKPKEARSVRTFIDYTYPLDEQSFRFHLPS